MTSQPPPNIKFGGTYSVLAAEDGSTTSSSRSSLIKNKLKIGSAILLLCVVAIMFLSNGNSNNNNTQEQLDLNDPELFQKLVDSDLNPSIDDEDLNTYEVDAEDLPVLPKGCKSRRHEHPGTPSGARIHFLYIPKNGGASIIQAMKTWNRGHVYQMSTLVDGTNDKCTSVAGNYAILTGMRGFGYCKDIAESKRGLLTFTTLRDPIARIANLFELERRRQSKFFTRVFGTTSLNEWLKTFNKTRKVEEGEAFIRFLGSQQARYLCGYDCFIPKTKSLNTERVLLSRAKANLQKIDAITVSDRMDDLIPQLKMHLRFLPVGFKTWPSIEDTNGNFTSDLDAEARKILAAYSRVDMELYQTVDKLAAAKTKAAVDCLEKM